MGNREQQLQAIGVTIGELAVAGSFSLGVSAGLYYPDVSALSGYSDYTPVRVRSHTKRKQNADVESNKNRG